MVNLVRGMILLPFAIVAEYREGRLEKPKYPEAVVIMMTILIIWIIPPAAGYAEAGIVGAVAFTAGFLALLYCVGALAETHSRNVRQRNREGK